jgi:hypothetical protein
MKRNALVALLVFALSTSTSAVGVTTRIVFEGADLVAPLTMSDAAAVSRFHVWSGPGTGMNGVRATEGFIANWSAGAVAARPEGLRRYEVSFYVKPRQTYQVPADAPEELAYVVDYEGDETQGFVLIPGRTDPRYQRNTRSIYRGVEGQWFRATVEWHRFVNESLAQRSFQP